jgi:hypothetical protein
MRRAFVLTLVVLGLATAAPAGLFYDNGAPNSLNGNEMTEWTQAEDFTVASPVVLTDARFWAFGVSEPGSYAGSIVWSLYADGSGQPAALLDRGSVVPARAFDHSTPYGPSYQYDFSVGSLNLVAGTYWLGLHNGPLTTDTRSEFYWETTGANLTVRGNEDITPFDTGGWYNNGQEHAFELYANPVPVPGAVLLGSIGLGYAGMRLRRRTA